MRPPLIDMEGQPTTAASQVRVGHRATSDAPVLAWLRAGGGGVVGKCNLHEFSFETTGEDSAFGPTRNPRALGHMAGGSSSGSAASVAAGMAMASVGTDTGGSIRIPAAACGVVGLKPTLGELSTDGVVPLAPTLDHVGPLGLTVDDVAVVYRVMAGDHMTVEEDPRDGRPANHRHPTARLGVPTRYFLDLLDTDVRRAFEGVLARLREAGCHIDEVNIPHTATIAATYRHTQLYEAFQFHRHTLETRADDYSPDVYQRLASGRALSEEDYLQTQRDRLVLRSEVDTVLEGVSALVLPTLAFPAPALGFETRRPGRADQRPPVRVPSPDAALQSDGASRHDTPLRYDSRRIAVRHPASGQTRRNRRAPRARMALRVGHWDAPLTFCRSASYPFSGGASRSTGSPAPAHPSMIWPVIRSCAPPKPPRTFAIF